MTTTTKERTMQTATEENELTVTPVKMIWLFVIGCFAGFLLESVFCLFTKGYIESRKGMIYGPFNQVYGFGAVIMVILLTPLARKGNGYLFFGGAITGGVFEYFASWLQEKVIGTVSWDYTGSIFSIGGRTSLVFMFYWGVAAIALMRIVYPPISRLLDRIPRDTSATAARVMAGFMAVNMLLSLTAVARWHERLRGVEATNAYEAYIDETYTNERLEQIYPNMRVTSEALDLPPAA